MFSIRKQLLILAAVATGSIWGGAFLQYRNLVTQSERLTQIRDGLLDGEAYVALATATARERGLTNGWMQAPPAQRNDQTLQAARAALNDSLIQLGPAAGRLMDPAVASRILDLNRYRGMADRHEAVPASIFAWYSGLVATVQDSAAQRLATGMIEVGLPYEHVTHLTQAVEHLAQIRGIVNGALFSGPETAVQVAELTRQLTLHREYISLYERSAPRKALVENAAAVSDPAVQGTIDLAQRLIDQRDPALLGIAAAAWWQLATRAVDTLQAVATRETQALTEQADQRMAGLERQMKLLVAALIVLGLLTLGLTLATVTRIVQGLNALLTGLDGVASRGNFDTRIDLKQRDEFSTISGSINKLIVIAASVVAEREKESLTDPLTGLLNRRGMNAQMGARLHPDRHSGRQFSAMMIDVDHFKRINDNYGHPAGDQVLMLVAGIFNSHVRADDVASRYGGEEFLALLTGCDLDAAQQIAEKIRQRVETFDFGIGSTVTVSIGLAEWSPGQDINVLIADADSALYRAKAAGRNRVFSLQRTASGHIPSAA